MLRQTSLQAYNDIRTDGSALTEKRKVYNLISSFSCGVTRQEISEQLRMPINSVCGRVNELMKNGFVFEDGKRLNPNSGKWNLVVKSVW